MGYLRLGIYKINDNTCCIISASEYAVFGFANDVKCHPVAVSYRGSYCVILMRMEWVYSFFFVFTSSFLLESIAVGSTSNLSTANGGLKPIT